MNKYLSAPETLDSKGTYCDPCSPLRSHGQVPKPPGPSSAVIRLCFCVLGSAQVGTSVPHGKGGRWHEAAPKRQSDARVRGPLGSQVLAQNSVAAADKWPCLTSLSTWRTL